MKSRAEDRQHLLLSAPVPGFRFVGNDGLHQQKVQDMHHVLLRDRAPLPWINEGITSTYFLSIKIVASLQLARSAVQAIQTSTMPYKMAAARNRTHLELCGLCGQPGDPDSPPPPFNLKHGRVCTRPHFTSPSFISQVIIIKYCILFKYCKMRSYLGVINQPPPSYSLFVIFRLAYCV